VIQQLRNLEDPELQPYRCLHGAKTVVHPKVGPCFVCEGRFLVEEALQAGREGFLRVLSVLATPKLAPELERLLPENAKLFEAEESALSGLLGFSFHRGVLCCAAVPPEPQEKVLLESKRLLVLPRLDDQDNLGLLLRSAAALGVEGVLVGKGHALFRRRTVRVSMGAVWKLPVLQREDPAAWLEDWRRADSSKKSEIIGAALGIGTVEAGSWEPAPRCALVLGPEGPGLDEKWLSRCDRTVSIPMQRGMDSLNVAAAGAILMFWMQQSAWKADPAPLERIPSFPERG
jgi:tRNA G18 (ribose-2'-O)-methylase SpoU